MIVELSGNHADQVLAAILLIKSENNDAGNLSFNLVTFVYLGPACPALNSLGLRLRTRRLRRGKLCAALAHLNVNNTAAVNGAILCVIGVPD